MTDQAPPQEIIDTPPAIERRAERSPQIDKLAAALNKAQAKLDDARKTSTANAGSFKYDYADLTEIWRVARPVLAANGLAVVQTFDKGETSTCLVTTLTHVSGQFIESRLPLMLVKDYHALGSAITYSRRYSLAAIVGIAPQGEDDDGAAAMQSAAPVVGSRKSYPRKGPRAVAPAAEPAQAKSEPADRDDGRPRTNRTAQTNTTTTTPEPEPDVEPASDLDDLATAIAKGVPGCVEYLRAFNAWNDALECVKEFARANVIKQGVEGMAKVVAENEGGDQ